MVRVAGQDALHQVPGPWDRSFGVDRRLSVERAVTAGQRRRWPGAVNLHGWQWAVRVRADAPRVQQHAGKITDVVGVEVGDKHGVQAPKIEAGVYERRRCPAAAINDKNAVADNER